MFIVPMWGETIARTKKSTTKTVEPLPERKDLPPKWECKLYREDITKDDTGWNHKRVDAILEEFATLSRAGYTMKEMASHFNMLASTLYSWTKINSALKDAVTEGRRASDERVERSLYESCFDRTVKEVTIETNANNDIIKTITKTRVIPANPTAIQYWLSNRANDRWKARQQLDISATENTAIPIRLVYDLEEPTESVEEPPKDL